MIDRDALLLVVDALQQLGVLNQQIEKQRESLEQLRVYLTIRALKTNGDNKGVTPARIAGADRA